MAPLRILLVDDHALFRAGVASLLESHANLQVVGEAEDGVEAINLARELLPDVVLMDIDMPRCTGLEATKVISTELPTIKIVILTVSDHDTDLFEAIKAGAEGYLLKDIRPKQFFELLDGFQCGGPPLIAEKMASRILLEFKQMLGRGEESRLDSGNSQIKTISEGDTILEDNLTPLSDRETEVLELVEEGKTNKEIAALLNVTEDTVKIHLRNIMEKLHLNNRVQAAVFSVKKRLDKRRD